MLNFNIFSENVISSLSIVQFDYSMVMTLNMFVDPACASCVPKSTKVMKMNLDYLFVKMIQKT